MKRKHEIVLTETEFAKHVGQFPKEAEAAFDKFERIRAAGGKPVVYHVIGGGWRVVDDMISPFRLEKHSPTYWVGTDAYRIL